jgi:predicted nucleic acid-binding protein
VKVFLDTNVIFPTVMREVILGLAARGLYQPLWSDRVLEEWARAAARLGAEAELQARGQGAILNRDFPKARVVWQPSLEDRLWLPDIHDRHVLAGAIAGSADLIVTQNASDFPRNILAEEGLSRIDADGFCMGFMASDPDITKDVCAQVLARAREFGKTDWHMRALLKKARLPRLAKAVSAQHDDGKNPRA